MNIYQHVKKYMNLYDYIEEYNFKNIKVIDDTDAWIKNPDYNFIYNKLWIAQSQGISCGPMNVYPNKYPIVFKPIINLYGMSRGFKIITDEKEYDENIKDGFFWEEYLKGDHCCVDLIIVKGKVKFFSALRSIPSDNGSFEYHESIPEYELPEHITFWISEHLEEYTGPINIELINGLIIEAHLRLNGDFQLYNKEFVSSLDNLYETGSWDLLNFEIEKKYLIPIFVEKNISKNKLNIIEKNIFLASKKFKLNNLLVDNINSQTQSEYLSRAFMIDISNIIDGFYIKKKIFLNQHNI